MVQVNKLGKGSAPVKPVTAPQAPANPPQPTGNLIQSNSDKSLAPVINIPAFLQQSTMPDIIEQELSGYIGFASTQSPKWSQMSTAGLKDGQPFALIEKQYIPLDKVDFFLCAGESFQTCLVGRESEFKFATRDLELKGPTFGTNKTEPHYVVLMIVDINGTLTPIKGDFRGTKSGGCAGAIAAVRAAADAEWLNLSEQHRATAAFPQPFGRVFHTLTTKYEVSKSSGNPYYRTLCVSAPAPISQMKRLVEALQDDEFQKKLAEANDNFRQRIAFLDAKVEQFKPKA